VDSDAALKAAAESQARWRAGNPLGPIDGVPASIKDNIWVKGLPTRRGSRTSETTPAQADSPAVARLREQGAVVLGKTCIARARLDWRLPLAAHRQHPRGMPSTHPAARPAAARWPCCLVWACCISAPTAPVRCVSRPLLPGVFGIKPSFGRVPVYPALMLNVLSHQGPITRTVADAATMLSVIAQPNGRDMAAWNTPAPNFSAGLNDGVRGLRVAFSARLGQDFALDPEIEAASRKAARVLEQAMQMPPPPGLGG
jgi:aspartyl-tRNA(Asn)/glutamyl-tRNA(Gln) amidotransferase subunit A